MGNIYRKLKWIFSRSKRLRQPVVVFNEMYVTIDWPATQLPQKETDTFYHVGPKWF
jgi:hypothetical protein